VGWWELLREKGFKKIREEEGGGMSLFACIIIAPISFGYKN
jgi:hypothetical protein